MANIARSYTVGNIWQGPADVFANVTAPTSALYPAADSDALTILMDASGQPTSATGIHLGSTEGPASIQITEKSNEIMDDQHESPVDVAFDSITAEIDITMKETNLSRLYTLLTSGLLGSYTALAAQQAMQFGGQLDCSKTPVTLMLVSPDRTTAGKWLYVFVYKCYLKSAIQASFQRSKETVYKLKFGAFCDLTRVSGDELMQIVRTR